MSASTHFHIWVVVFALTVPLAGRTKTKVEFDHEADFSQIRTYQWRTHPLFEKNPALRDDYTVGIHLVLNAGNEQLPKRGLTPVDSSPDVFVTFFILGKSIEKEVTTSGGFGPGWYAPSVWTTTEIENYVDGTLVMDIVDAKTTKLLWRAYCGAQVKDWNNRHKVIEGAARTALSRYPPKSK
jgi:hypothetical protein